MTPLNRAGSDKPCKECDRYREKLQSTRETAEKAFAELRSQADRELAAVHSESVSKVNHERQRQAFEINRLREELNQRNSEIIRLKQEVVERPLQTSNDLSDMNERMALYEREKLMSRQNIVELQTELSERDALIGELQAQLKQLAKDMRPTSVDDQVDREMKLRLKSVSEANTRLVSELEERDIEINKLHEELNHLQNDLREANQQLSDCETKDKDVEHEKVRLELIYQKKMTESEAELRRAQIRIASLERERDQLTHSVKAVSTDADIKCSNKETEMENIRAQLKEERKHSHSLAEKSQADRLFIDKLIKERSVTSGTIAWSSPTPRLFETTPLSRAPSRTPSSRNY